MNGNVSIVVPAYNSERYLAECLDSIALQPEVGEIIVVDDGSADGTLQLALGYSKRDSRIKVLHQSNAGVSVARNRGMAAVSLPWMAFVDADDVLPGNAIEALLAAAEEYHADMVFGDHAVIHDGVVVSSSNEFEGHSSGMIPVDNMIASLTSAAQKSVSGACWRALIRSSLPKKAQVRFPEGIAMSEDYCFMLKCLMLRPRVAYIKRLVYLLRRDGGSVTQRYLPSLEHDMNYVNDQMYVACSCSDVLLHNWQDSVANTAWTVCENLYKDGAPYGTAERRNEIFRIMHEYHDSIKRIHFNGSLDNKKVFVLKLGAVCPPMIWIALEMRNRNTK